MKSGMRVNRNWLFWLLLCQPMTHSEVVLTDQVRANFGITTVVANTEQVARHWQATAQVLDTATLISGLADLHAAQATVTASNNEVQRLEALYKADNAALKAVEAARAQAANDHARVQSLQAQLLAGWGTAITRLPTAAREQLMHEILAGKIALIRAEVAASAPTSLGASSVTMKLLNDDRGIKATLLGTLPQKNAQSVGKAYLLSASVTDQLDLQPGEVLSADLQDSTHKLSGIKLPQAAVVRWQGQQWAYVETAVGHYQRVTLHITQSMPDGLLVSDGIKAGEKVVSVGAVLLLGAELAPTRAENTAAKED
jgi:hypothetical protein